MRIVSSNTNRLQPINIFRAMSQSSAWIYKANVDSLLWVQFYNRPFHIQQIDIFIGTPFCWGLKLSKVIYNEEKQVLVWERWKVIPSNQFITNLRDGVQIAYNHTQKKTWKPGQRNLNYLKKTGIHIRTRWIKNTRLKKVSSA